MTLQVSTVAISAGLHPVLASGSWDSCVKIWATREGGVSGFLCVCVCVFCVCFVCEDLGYKRGRRISFFFSLFFPIFFLFCLPVRSRLRLHWPLLTRRELNVH